MMLPYQSYRAGESLLNGKASSKPNVNYYIAYCVIIIVV